jgi:CHAT domain-containing protein
MDKKFIHIIFLLFIYIGISAQNYQELSTQVAKLSNTENEKALHYARLASVEASLEFGKTSRQYAESLNIIGEILKNKENFQDAEKYFLKSRSYFSDSLDTNCEENGVNLMSLGKFYQETNQYEKAYFWFNKFIHFSNQTGSDCKGGFAYVGDFYSAMGDYKKAKFYLEKNVNDCDFLAKKAPLEYAYRIGRLADFYANMGNYLATEKLYQKCLPVFQKYIPKEHPEWAYMQSKYLSFLVILKNYKKADKVINDLFQIPYTKSSIEIMQNIANAYWQMNRKEEAEIFFLYCIKLSEQQSLDGKCSDIRLYSNLGAMYIALKDYEKADDYLELAEKIAQKEDILNKINLKKANEEDKDRYITILTNLGTLHNARKEHEEAIDYFNKAWKVISSSAKINDGRGREILNQLIIAYDATNDYKSLEKMLDLDIHQAISTQTSRILPVVGTKLRAQYLEKNERINHILASVLTSSFKNIENSGELIYDYCLLTKGVALQWNLGDLAKSRRSSDSSVVIMYKKWQNAKNQIASAQQRNGNTEFLNTQLEEIESILTQKLSLSKDYFKPADWRQIQAQLEQNEVAIEFLAVPYFSYEQDKYSRDTLYFASILGYNSPSPDVVFLFEQKQLQSLLLNGDDFYRDQASYELIWSKIAPFTNNITKVYYAPVGLLNDVSLAALTRFDGKILIENYQFQTLLSTRNIILHKENSQQLNKGETLIFAGMNYDEQSKTGNYYSSNSSSIENNLMLTNIDSLLRFDMMRGKDLHYNKLHYTSVEGLKIHQINEQKGISSRFFTDKYASEYNIKNCTFRKNAPNVLIISTHGFYNSRDTSSTSPFSWNSEPLMRCGLAMSGANLFANDNKLFGDTNEGIWTGYEIEQSNLAGTQLVILSACESANGEINNSEGVYGLQRAFKLAGAEYVLVCLNKIHDQMASEFVISFYEKIANGEKIPTAFHQTQLAIKAKYPNTLDWANWILME